MAVKIEHRLGVPTPASVIWGVISDLPGWKAWNPFYIEAEGALGFGARLTLTENPKYASGKSNVIQPTVVDWTPDAQIIWKLSQMGGLVQRTRYIEIEALNETGCIFSNGEIWEGRLGALVVNRKRRALRAGFEALDEAVKERAIQVWREAGGKPT